jgi:hypothetical protein
MAEKGKTPYYFPSKEADVIPWVKNFVMVLFASAARWGIAAKGHRRAGAACVEQEGPWSGIISAIVP